MRLPWSLLLVARRSGGYIYYSNPGATLWDTISAGSPFIFNREFTLSAVVGGQIYATYNLDIYQSSDSGRTWEIFDTIPRSIGLRDMYTENDRLIITGSNGIAISKEDGTFHYFDYNDCFGFLLPTSVILSDGSLLVGTRNGLQIIDTNGTFQQMHGMPGGSQVVRTETALYTTNHGGIYRRELGEEFFTSLCPPSSSRPFTPLLNGFGKDTIVALYYDTLFISPDRGNTWQAPQIIPTIGHDRVPRSFWINDFGWFVEQFSHSSGKRLIRSTNHGRNWIAISFPGETRDSLSTWTIVQGPESENNDIYWTIFKNNSFQSYLSQDGGDSWIRNGTSQLELAKRMISNRPRVERSRGLKHIALSWDDYTSIILYQNGIDTVRFESKEDQAVTINRYDSVYLAIVEPADAYDQQYEVPIPVSQFYIRRVDEQEWYRFDLQPGKKHLTNSSPQTFFPTADGLYAFSRGGYLWLFTSFDEPPHSRYNLTVSNGYGSGEYRPGDTVDINAFSLGSHNVFDGWKTSNIDDEAQIAHPAEWHTKVIMPARDVTITGTYKELTVHPWQQDIIYLGPGDTAHIAYVTPSGKTDDYGGIILVVDNAGKTPNEFFANVEGNQFVRDALDRGFGVVTLASQESIAGDINGNDTIEWNLDFTNPDANLDLRHVRAIVASFGNYGDGVVVPVWILSLGGNGSFAAGAASVLHSPAIAFTTASPKLEWMSELVSPAAFVVAVQDNNHGFFPKTSGRDLALTHQWNNRVSLYEEHLPSTLYPERFARIPSIDTVTSRKILEEMIQAGHFHSSDMLPNGRIVYTRIDKYQFDTLRNSTAAPVLAGLDSAIQEAVWRQLLSTASGPTFFSDLNELILDFFEEHNTAPNTSGVKHEPKHNLDIEMDLSALPKWMDSLGWTKPFLKNYQEYRRAE